MSNEACQGSKEDQRMEVLRKNVSKTCLLLEGNAGQRRDKKLLIVMFFIFHEG